MDTCEPRGGKEGWGVGMRAAAMEAGPSRDEAGEKKVMEGPWRRPWKAMEGHGRS